MAARLPLAYDPSTVVLGNASWETTCAPAIVAIPAHDEADRIGACLAALAGQRDATGTPLPVGSFDVLVLANNCTDDTAALARACAEAMPHRLLVIECCLPPGSAHAGGARKAAMDHAADLLAVRWLDQGVILTTDADSRVQPTWVSTNLAELAQGVDAVAGYVDADPGEFLALGAAFMRRGRLEDRFLSRVAELHALLDPRRHDPWPNHGVHSGASFALTVGAYRAIGGLPSRPLGEDAALARALEGAGLLIRHSLTAAIVTSCRFDSRAPGGAGDTMRHRHANPDAACDDDLEATMGLFRRARTRGLLRRLHAAGRLGDGSLWRRRLGFDRETALALIDDGADRAFADLWDAIERASPVLRRGQALRPSDLTRETAKLERLLQRLRRLGQPGSGDPAGIPARVVTRRSRIAAPSQP